MGAALFVLAAVLVVGAAACGGIAVLDGTAGEGGSGGSSGRSTATTTTTSLLSSSSTGPSYECEQACGVLYDCALGTDPDGVPFCPGLTGDPAQREDFIGYCVDTTIGCTTALQFVQPGNCLATVTYFKSNNAQFVYQCKYGTD